MKWARGIFFFSYFWPGQKFAVLWFKMCATDHNEILHASRQCHCRDVCKILLWLAECVMNKSLAKFYWTSLVGRAPGVCSIFVLEQVGAEKKDGYMHLRALIFTQPSISLLAHCCLEQNDKHCTDGIFNCFLLKFIVSWTRWWTMGRQMFIFVNENFVFYHNFHMTVSCDH